MILAPFSAKAAEAKVGRASESVTDRHHHISLFSITYLCLEVKSNKKPDLCPGREWRDSIPPHKQINSLVLCSNSSICANFFPAKIKRVACLALRRKVGACAKKHSFSKREKRGTQYQYKMDSVLRNYFLGQDSQNRD